MVETVSIKPQGADRRRSPRKRALLTGRVAYGEGAFTLNCTIRDISSTGARIALPKGQTVPNELYLVDVRNGCAYEAEVAWRGTFEVGLIFVARKILVDLADPRLRFLREIWIEAAVR